MSHDWMKHDFTNETSIDLYLKDVERYPLITPEQEQTLAKEYLKGSQAAYDKLVTSNLRLVIHIAQQYRNYGLPLEDLIAEGNIGLMRGVQGFRPARGAKLSTYAGWWIRQSIRRALSNKARTIRLPAHVVTNLHTMRKQEWELEGDLGREPTDDELADFGDVPVQRIKNLKTSDFSMLSFNTEVGGEEKEGVNRTLADVIADDGPAPDEILATEDMLQILDKLIDRLSVREATVIQMRFGLRGMKSHTLDEIGKKFKVTRERIRQIQNSVIKILRKEMKKKNVTR